MVIGGVCLTNKQLTKREDLYPHGMLHCNGAYNGAYNVIAAACMPRRQHHVAMA